MLERLKSKLSIHGQAQAASGSDIARSRSNAANTQEVGLHPLFSTSVISSANAPLSKVYAVDLVAIHGLTGDAYTTWTHPDSNAMWLRDYLPTTLPGCRVFTYGYPAKVCFQSFGQVRELAQSLLAELRGLQQESDSARRPIIFICHSLGGIVFKQALVIAHHDSQQYGEVLDSFIGVAFFGTPHQGSQTANLAGVLNVIGSTPSVAASVGLRSKVARTGIKLDSKQLQELSSQARFRLQKLCVASFYENAPTPPLSSLVVDRESATLNLTNEEIIPLYENHLDICRFASRSKSYEIVAKAIQRIAIKTAQQ